MSGRRGQASSTLLALGLLAACALAAATACRAQDYPSKPIKLIVPYPPGGSADILARVVGQKLGEQLGQAIVVENRAGAGTAIGAEFVARSRPDGYTLLLGTVSSHAMNPALSPSVGYDAIKDFSPVAPLATIPFVLDVNAQLPVRSVKELVAYAKVHPGTINYSSAGNGTSNHLATGGTRVASLPEVPTMKESGYSDYEVSAWFGIFAPAGTPDAVVTRLNAEAAKALASPEVRDKLGPLGMESMGGTPQSFARLVAADLDKWRDVVKSAKIRAD
jgi:tripartite-type tricarboxylate transporter receptor subunit TctC